MHYVFHPEGVAEPVNSTTRGKASAKSPVRKICLWNTALDEPFALRGKKYPSGYYSFYTNGDIETRENGKVVKTENIGCEITISDMEKLGKKYLP